MERLGLWGEGAPFKTFEQFLDSVQRKGLGMAEMVAMEMKTSGMYVSRGLSFKQAEVWNKNNTQCSYECSWYCFSNIFSMEWSSGHY